VEEVKQKQRRIDKAKERVRIHSNNKEKKNYISSKSQYNLGVIRTRTKVRGGDIYHFIFLLLSSFISS